MSDKRKIQQKKWKSVEYGKINSLLSETSVDRKSGRGENKRAT
jgi:hypothetical protein